MGHAAFNSIFSQSSDANFRSWVGSFIAGAIAGGWVQTTDTGQANPATITKPTATGSANAVYAIFRFDDELQDMYPLFVKLWFGTSSTTTDYPTMWLSVGTGTDGAGNLTGVLLDVTSLTGALPSASTSAQPCVVGSGEGWLALLSGIGRTVGGFGYPHVVIERSRSADGSPTGSGVAVILPGTSSSNASFTSGTGLLRCVGINYATGAQVLGAVPVVVPGLVQGVNLGPGTSLAAGGIGPVFPIVYLAPGVAPWQSMAVVAIPQGDMPAGVFTVPLLGRTVSMYPCPASVANQWGVAYSSLTVLTSMSNYVGCGLRWDE